MTTLPGRENTALLVIDMQNGIVDGGYNREGVIANIGVLVERARGAGVPVICSDRRLRALDPARRDHARIRRNLGARRAHHGGFQFARSTAAGAGDRPHEPLLGLPHRPRTDRGGSRYS
jgi:hypothetical protein